MRRSGGGNSKARLRPSRIPRPVRRRDFQWLWIGAFLSFIGSWIQNVAQGYHVFLLTHDEAKLALVSFCSSVPVFIIGPVAGAVTDMFHKRLVLILTEILFAIGALFLAAADYFHFIQYWHFIAVSLLFGIVAAVEMPARQSVVSRVVPPEELAEAIPINAMTFNAARILGPAISGVLLAKYGPGTCYFANGISYLALVFSAVVIRADMSPSTQEPQGIRDLLVEGMRYTFRDVRLRTLFILESSTSMFALIYLALMPAFLEDVLHMSKEVSKRQLGFAYSCVGVGAFAGLAILLRTAAVPHKARLVRISMVAVGILMFLVGTTRSVTMAYVMFGLIGMATIIQFNLTNTLFQLLSPDRLRGRVLSMHMWALSGIGPFGTLAGGYLASAMGIPFTFRAFGVILLAFSLWAVLYKRGLSGVDS